MPAAPPHGSIPPAPRPLRRLLVASTSIDLIDLTAAGDRYSNFNPCYKSTTPPDDVSLPYPEVSEAGLMPQASMPILHEHVEQTYAVTIKKAASRSAGHLTELGDHWGVRASWAGYPHHSSSSSSPSPSSSPVPPPPPPPPQAALRRVSPPYYRHGARSRLEGTPRDVQRSQEDIIRAPESRIPRCSTTSLRSSWLYIPEPESPGAMAATVSNDNDPDTHFYWELEFPTRSTESPPMGEVSTAVVVGPSARHKNRSPRPDIQRSHSSSPVAKSLAAEDHGDIACGVRPKKQLSPPRAGPSQSAVRTRSPSLWVPRPKSTVEAKSQQDLSDNDGSERSTSFFRRRSPGRRSQSCEQLSHAAHAKKNSKQRSRRRCPTPPRVLSPGIDSIKYEMIADI